MKQQQEQNRSCKKKINCVIGKTVKQTILKFGVFALMMLGKYETLLKQLEKVDDAIINADVSTTQIKDFFTIKQNLIYQIDSLEKKVSIKSNVVTSNYMGEKEDIPMRLFDV